jgi:hypothetical protein
VFKRLLLLALLAAAAWLTYRQLRPRAAEPLLTRTDFGPSPHPSHPTPRLPTDRPPPPATQPWPPAGHAPAAAEVADQAAGRGAPHDPESLARPAMQAGQPGAQAPAEAVEQAHVPAEAVEQAAPDAEEPPAAGAVAPAEAHPLGTAEGERTVEGYCMRCKEHRTMSDVQIATAANGRRSARGVCPVCGAKMSTFLPNTDSVRGGIR